MYLENIQNGGDVSEKLLNRHFKTKANLHVIRQG